MKQTHILITALLSALALPAFAADEHKHKEGEKHKDHPKVEVAIPESAAALWTEIETKTKELGGLVSEKKEAGLHAVTETVEALILAIPAKHADLDGDKKKRVEGMAKTIARTLDSLHEESEEGHWDDAAKKFGQVQAALKLIKQQIGK